MWFVLLGIALSVVAVGGMYVRRRVLSSLEVFGVSNRSRRVIGYCIPWLLFAYPVLTFLYVGASIALGRDSFSMSAPAVVEWIVAYPFWMSMLVMLQALPFLLVADLAYLAATRRGHSDRARRYRASACLVVLAVFALYTPTRILVERGDLNVVHYEVGAGQSDKPLRIVFFADLQQDQHTDRQRADQVVSLINHQAPDLILVGGDWVNTGSEHIDAAAVTASKLRSRLGTFSVRGDHEHFAYRDQDRSVRSISDALARHNVPMIHNEVRWVEHGGKRIAVIYLSYNYVFRTPKAEIQNLLRRVQGADYSIVVTHQFDTALAQLVKNRVDLALIAHTHGGQVNPVVGFVHVPLARVETPYIAGRYQLGSTTLIVTSGIGFSIAPFRYASPASIEVIDLHL